MAVRQEHPWVVHIHPGEPSSKEFLQVVTCQLESPLALLSSTSPLATHTQTPCCPSGSCRLRWRNTHHRPQHVNYLLIPGERSPAH